MVIQTGVIQTRAIEALPKDGETERLWGGDRPTAPQADEYPVAPQL